MWIEQLEDQTALFDPLWRALSRSKGLRILKVVFQNREARHFAEIVSVPPLGEVDTNSPHLTDAASLNLSFHDIHMQ